MLCGPGIYSVCKRNEYKELSWVVKCGRRVSMTTSPPSVSWLSRQCGILDISQSYRPPRHVIGTALLFPLLYKEQLDSADEKVCREKHQTNNANYGFELYKIMYKFYFWEASACTVVFIFPAELCWTAVQYRVICWTYLIFSNVYSVFHFTFFSCSNFLFWKYLWIYIPRLTYYRFQKDCLKPLYCGLYNLWTRGEFVIDLHFLCCWSGKFYRIYFNTHKAGKHLLHIVICNIPRDVIWSIFATSWSICSLK
jgi:hypothetical protein